MTVVGVVVVVVAVVNVGAVVNADAVVAASAYEVEWRLLSLLLLCLS